MPYNIKITRTTTVSRKSQELVQVDSRPYTEQEIAEHPSSEYMTKAEKVVKNWVMREKSAEVNLLILEQNVEELDLDAVIKAINSMEA